MIAVCRAVNADPQFVNKLKRNQEEEIRPCLRCNACIANYQTRITKCAINPTLDRPEDEVFPFLPTTPKRVLIAGGGPAGLEAAIVAKDRGHEVILCEKTGTLGGLLRYARKVPFKRETQQYVDYMIAKRPHGRGYPAEHRGHPRAGKGHRPRLLYRRRGSKALIPPIPGVEKAHPIMDMYDGKVQVGQKVVIVGGGLAGTEAALELAMQGKQVTLVEMGIDVARDANSIHKPALMMELKDHAEQVTILRRTTCTGIHDHGIVCRDADGKELTLDADTVILAAGMAPLRAEALALEPVSSEFRMVGDCKRPRQILEAVREGYDAAMGGLRRHPDAPMREDPIPGPGTCAGPGTYFWRRTAQANKTASAHRRRRSCSVSGGTPPLSGPGQSKAWRGGLTSTPTRPAPPGSR